MTLGEFRKITEQYGDDCTLYWAHGYSEINYPNLVSRVIVDIDAATDDEPNPVPCIVVL